jgi:DNA invertase Pin-like site-specific DNA recombinase
MLHLYAALAEKERSLIAQRTKDALAAAKARGVKLGNPKGAKHLKGRGNREAVEAITQDAQDRAKRLAGVLDDLRSQGITSANGMAQALNQQGIATARGGQWTARSVLNVLKRLGG